MKILYLTNNCNLGSTARILQDWLRLGREAGIGGSVVARSEGDFPDWMRKQGTRVCISPMPSLDKWRPWRASWQAWRVDRFAGKTDIIHVNEHDVYPFAFVLKRLMGVPTVCHVRYRIDRGFAEWAFGGNRCPDALLWTSQQQKDDSTDAVKGIVPESRQHIVRLGFDVNTYGIDDGKRLATRQALGIADDEIVVGTASPLRPRKRVHEFIEIAKRLAPRHPKAVFLIAGGLIAGDEAYRDQIERQIAESGLGRQLRGLGFLEPVEPFYHASDIQVSTSEYETFGNSVCEAMACARPVAAYRGGSVGEVVGDAGLIVDTGDLPGLTSAVEKLVVDHELRKSMGQAARRRVADCFSPRKSFEQLQGIYGSLCTKEVAA